MNSEIAGYILVSQCPVQSPSTLCVGKSGIGTGFVPNFFRFSPLINIPPLFHTHLTPPPDKCNSSDQVAHYHTPVL
jgi:hypothetical protein